MEAASNVENNHRKDPQWVYPHSPQTHAVMATDNIAGGIGRSPKTIVGPVLDSCMVSSGFTYSVPEDMTESSILTPRTVANTVLRKRTSRCSKPQSSKLACA
ncbi:MAG: hypothetical protein AB4040_11800 [Synechococcus sp.]